MKTCNCKCDGSCKSKEPQDPVDFIVPKNAEDLPTPEPKQEVAERSISPPSDDLVH